MLNVFFKVIKIDNCMAKVAEMYCTKQNVAKIVPKPNSILGLATDNLDKRNKRTKT